MNLESLPKFYAPKSPNLNGTPPATGGMTITDVMTAQGFVQSKATLGFNLFLAKAGIQPPEKAIERLAEVAFVSAGRCPRIAALPDQQRTAVCGVLAAQAYHDYSRSAASVRPCDCCGGKGFIDAEIATMKTMGRSSRLVREPVRVLCTVCRGKRVISNACRCHGKGRVEDLPASEMQGVPVWKTCDRCSGRGYSRLKFSAVLAGLREVWPELKKTTAYDLIGPFFEMLVSRCHAEEAAAGEALRQVTR
ncbi:antitermination protein [Salmonella enterica subsp. enterica]|nr:antitermination protein [Salmonella enterica subsp. enterica]EDU8875906.1 antitermination protein [Salmonella enterica subsp. enterica]